MSRPVTSSDLHLGHRNIIKYRKQFKTCEEHDDTIIDAHKATIKKNDTWICLGDVAFTKEALQRLKEIKCRRKVLIMGNHDLERVGITMQDLLEVFDAVYGFYSHKCYGKKLWFTHAPIHPDEVRYRDFVIHGHTHDKLINHPKYINVCVDHTNWGAVPLEELLNKPKPKGIKYGISRFLSNLIRRLGLDYC